MMGREERLENLRPRRIRHPLAIIDDMQLDQPGSRANLSPQKHTAHRPAGMANRIGQQVPQDILPYFLYYAYHKKTVNLKK